MSKTKFLDLSLLFMEYIQAKFLLASMIISGFLIPVFNYIEKYVFDDWDAAQYIMWLLIADMIAGIIKHYQQHTLNFTKCMTKTFIKGMICVLTMIVCKSLSAVGTEFNTTANYLEYFGKLVSILYIALSALKNLYWISGKKLPIGWLVERLDSTAKKLNNEKTLTDAKNN